MLKTKRTIVVLLVALFIFALLPPTGFAMDISLDLSATSGRVGDEITASGIADAEEWVSIKIVDDLGSVVYYEAVKSDAEGNYSNTFKIPDVKEGTLKVVAGYGSNVASKDFKVVTTSDTETHTITFKSGGVVYKTETVEVGQTIDEPATPKKEGYTFDGWYEDEEFTKLVKFPYTVTEDVTLYAKWSALGSGWDGETIDTSWYNTEATSFTISTPAQLAGVAAIANGTADGIAQDVFEDKTITLTADLDLGGVKDPDGTWNDESSAKWIPITGAKATKTTGKAFNGTFDGAGHVIYNLYLNEQPADWGSDYSGNNIGLFGIIDPKAVVKNLGVKGFIAGNRSVGGIVGKNNGRIENCFNAADVKGSQSKGVGGITGANWNTPSIVNCYNIGTVTTTYGTGFVGGMAGDNEYEITNCYNAGKIEATSQGASIGGIAGNLKGSSSVTNCYYNNELNDKGVGNNAGNLPISKMQGMTGDDMKKAELIALLNDNKGYAFVNDADNINSGYPILVWQTDKKIPPVLIEDLDLKTNQSANITFTDDEDWRNAVTAVKINGKSVNGYELSDGKLVIPDTAFKDGSKNYTIEVEANGYTNAIVLQALTAEYKIEIAELSGGTIEVSQVAGEEGDTITLTITPETGKRFVKGSLKYTTDGESYTEIEGNSFKMPASDVTITCEFERIPYQYTVTPQEDSTFYEIGQTTDGIKTMTVKDGIEGMKYFKANIESEGEEAHDGKETAVFVHLRNKMQMSVNTTVADFDADTVDEAGAGFNVKAGDVIKVFIVDKLTNDRSINPILLQR